MTTEPKSIRLTQQHRADMADAVIAEWEKQNPAPAAADHVAFLEVVAKEFKKHATHKRTKRMVDTLQADDLKHVHCESEIRVRIMNKQGEERRVTSVVFPLSIADRLGLVRLPSRHMTRRVCDAGLTQADLADADAPRIGMRDRLLCECAVFADRQYPMVQIQDDNKALVKMREAKKARKEWEDERTRLRTETRDLLDQFNTTKQLREGWAEMVPYLPPHIADPEKAVRLPVMATSRLSERLGIKESN